MGREVWSHPVHTRFKWKLEILEEDAWPCAKTIVDILGFLPAALSFGGAHDFARASGWLTSNS